jgi:hypothetical protein
MYRRLHFLKPLDLFKSDEIPSGRARQCRAYYVYYRILLFFHPKHRCISKTKTTVCNVITNLQAVAAGQEHTVSDIAVVSFKRCQHKAINSRHRCVHARVKRIFICCFTAEKQQVFSHSSVTVTNEETNTAEKSKHRPIVTENLLLFNVLYAYLHIQCPACAHQ